MAIALAEPSRFMMRLPRFWVPLGAGSQSAGLHGAAGAIRNDRAGFHDACGATRNDKEGPSGCIRRLLDASGHTLVETLVAMSLFVGVLVPLLGARGNLIFDDRTERLQEALHLAQSEIALAEASQDSLRERTLTVHGLTIEQRVVAQGTLAQINVMVRDTKKANRLVLHLSKTVSFKPATSPG